MLKIRSSYYRVFVKFIFGKFMEKNLQNPKSKTIKN